MSVNVINLTTTSTNASTTITVRAPQPSTSVITPPARQLLSIEMMSILIVGGVVLLLAVVMIITTVLICLQARARRKQTQKVHQVGSNGRRGLEGPDDAFSSV